MKFALTLTFLITALIGTSSKTFADDSLKLPKRCMLYYGNALKLPAKVPTVEERLMYLVIQPLMEKGYGFTEHKEDAGNILTVTHGKIKKHQVLGTCDVGDVNYNSVFKFRSEDDIEKYNGDSVCLNDTNDDSLIAIYIVSISNALDQIPNCQ